MSEFTADFFSRNRERLMQTLPNSLIFISAHSLLQESADIAYPFRQDSNFWYLTGIDEPDLLLVLDTKNSKSILLLPEQNKYQKDWDGQLDKKVISKRSGISEIRFKSALNPLLKEAEKQGSKICYLKPPSELVEPYGFYSNPARRKLEKELCKLGGLKRSELVDIRKDVARLRMIKQQVEISRIEKAISVTGSAMAEIKKRLSEFKSEKDMVRELSVQFFKKADGHMFEPIVASGQNAATIHYRHNNAALTNDSLVLLDIGAKVGMYGADISRTWAVGTPSKRQKDVYAAVLEVHNNALARCKSGLVLKEQQKLVNEDLKKQYKKLGVSHVDLPHGVSHFLGIDTHDAGVYDEPLVENVIITVEPGIYLPDEGIGVRIEDDVLITKNGMKNLSESISREL